MMLPLNTHGKIEGVQGDEILKVLTFEEALSSDLKLAKCIIWYDKEIDFKGLTEFRGVICPTRLAVNVSGVKITELNNEKVIQPGDVIQVSEGKSLINVLYRRNSVSNTMFATERCDSLCLMCSQPPRDIDDGWRVQQILELIPLVDQSEEQLGLSGGEPTLLGDDLLSILLSAKNNLPETELHILSNGRKFADQKFVQVISAVGHPRILWGVPLYSSVESDHDKIVQSDGAWRETLAGLYNLNRFGHSIELRVVVQKDNVWQLGELANFIFRNLSFVRYVAFMALEPMGFAKKNREKIWVDPKEVSINISDAVYFLANRGVGVSLYNFQHCVVDEELWPFCRQSISDWKNKYLLECQQCQVIGDCCGFFKSAGNNWISTSVSPVEFKARGDYDKYVV